MAHYIGPKGRINRKLGVVVYEGAGAVRAFERKPNPPGMHARRRKVSSFGKALLEKQKLKHAYGLGERSLRRLFGEARRRGNAGAVLLKLCELQLANVVWRSGLAKTGPQARQGVVHGHFLVNGRKVDKPSFRMRAGDVVTVKNRPSHVDMYKRIVQESNGVVSPWLRVIPEELRVEVASTPNDGEMAIPIEIDLIVESLSR